MKLSDADIRHSYNSCFSSDSDNREKSELDDINNPAPLNKITECIKNPCDTCNKSKYIRIVNHEAMTPTVWKLKEIYADLLGLYDLAFILRKSYFGLLLDK